MKRICLLVLFVAVMLGVMERSKSQKERNIKNNGQTIHTRKGK